MTTSKPVRTAFYVSGSTAITAETLGRSMLTQFSEYNFRQVTLPYLQNPAQIEAAVLRIKLAAEEDGSRPIVFSTLTDPLLLKELRRSDALVLDLFDAFLVPLEREIGQPPTLKSGQSHAVRDLNSYRIRADAVHFAMQNDDGARTTYYDQADLIVIGVSRSGKTPTCLYMAMQYGLYMANYPLTEEDFDDLRLPKSLLPHQHKLFALTIGADRLEEIRQQRRGGSRYASRQQCDMEVRAFGALISRFQIPSLEVTEYSIEEISSRILAKTGLRRRLF